MLACAFTDLYRQWAQWTIFKNNNNNNDNDDNSKNNNKDNIDNNKNKDSTKNSNNNSRLKTVKTNFQKSGKCIYIGRSAIVCMKYHPWLSFLSCYHFDALGTVQTECCTTRSVYSIQTQFFSKKKIKSIFSVYCRKSQMNHGRWHRDFALWTIEPKKGTFGNK